LKIKNKTIKIKNLLEFTGERDIVKAVQKLNKQFADLEISILPL
jgi:hypothetical protein